MKPELDNQSVYRYLRVYNYYKELILSEKLVSGSRLPSIRQCAAQLQISRTTVETAYLALAAEGYILSKPQSGYYVTDIAKVRKTTGFVENSKTVKEPAIQYNFASANVDRNSFRFDIWQRYIKSALRQDERLLSYGEPQGEYDLREVLCNYLRKNRNVVCTPEHIVIGAGVQSLLHILCPLIKDRKKAAFQNPQFRQGRAVFQDYGFELSDSVEDTDADVYYLSPSQITAWGEVLPVQKRMELIRKASEQDILLVEDDYNSEFRYYNQPVPSIQGLAGGRGVVYLGTFSRLLLPSIRLSYMVLPPELMECYIKKRDDYNQTASKAEQIALCQFIRDGHLEAQIRKSRKLYQAKTKALCSEIQRVFGERAKISPGSAGFLSLMEIDTEKSAAELARLARNEGITVYPVELGDGKTRLMLSCAEVPVRQYPEAFEKLEQCFFGK